MHKIERRKQLRMGGGGHGLRMQVFLDSIFYKNTPKNEGDLKKLSYLSERLTEREREREGG